MATQWPGPGGDKVYHSAAGRLLSGPTRPWATSNQWRDLAGSVTGAQERHDGRDGCKDDSHGFLRLRWLDSPTE